MYLQSETFRAFWPLFLDLDDEVNVSWCTHFLPPSPPQLPLLKITLSHIYYDCWQSLETGRELECIQENVCRRSVAHSFIVMHFLSAKHKTPWHIFCLIVRNWNWTFALWDPMHAECRSASLAAKCARRFIKHGAFSPLALEEVADVLCGRQ